MNLKRWGNIKIPTGKNYFSRISIAVRVQFNFAPEDPIDACRVGNNQRHPDGRDDGHDLESFY